jgi:hypothetical protein
MWFRVRLSEWLGKVAGDLQASANLLQWQATCTYGIDPFSRCEERSAKEDPAGITGLRLSTPCVFNDPGKGVRYPLKVSSLGADLQA